MEKAFIRFLRKDKAHDDNTVNKVLKRLRAVLYEGYMEGVVSSVFYKHKGCSVTYVRQPKVYLNEQEIEYIRKLDLSGNDRLKKVRDKSLIGVWTGLRISDLSQFSKSKHLINEKSCHFLNIRKYKISTYTKIPLKTAVVSILDKFDDTIPTISDQKFNDYLKELCRIVSLNSKESRTKKGHQMTYEKLLVLVFVEGLLSSMTSNQDFILST